MRRCIGVFTTELQARSERANDVRGLFMEKRRQATQLLPSIFLILILTPSLLYGQTLDDFKTAAQSTGVQAIPYSSPRGDAASIQRDIASRKKELASFKDWKEYDRDKIENYKSIRLENEIIKKRQDYIDGLKAKGTDASQFQKELDENKKNQPKATNKRDSSHQ